MASPCSSDSVCTDSSLLLHNVSCLPPCVACRPCCRQKARQGAWGPGTQEDGGSPPKADRCSGEEVPGSELPPFSPHSFPSPPPPSPPLPPPLPSPLFTVIFLSQAQTRHDELYEQYSVSQGKLEEVCLLVLSATIPVYVTHTHTHIHTHSDMYTYR